MSQSTKQLQKDMSVDVNGLGLVPIVSRRNKRKREQSGKNGQRSTPKRMRMDNTWWSMLPEEMILEVCKHLPFHDIISLSRSSPQLAWIVNNPTIVKENVCLDLWKGDNVLAHAVKFRNIDSIHSITLCCQQNTSESRTEVTWRMLKQLRKMRGLETLNIEGAELKIGVHLFCNIGSSVKKLYLHDCVRGIFNWHTILKQTSLQTLCLCTSSSSVVNGFRFWARLPHFKMSQCPEFRGKITQFNRYIEDQISIYQKP